jgi:CubicO group peptidase (beta-lactamase class C family)
LNVSRRTIICTLAAINALFAWSSAAIAAPQALDASQRAAIDKIANDAIEQQGVPGISLAVARGSTILYARGYGYQNVQAKLPADADTIYAIGSNTKQFTATAVMLLAQDGKIDIDAKVARYLPAAPHASEITIRQLLTQTSGLAEYITQPGFSLTSMTVYSPAQLLALVENLPLKFTPGTQWEYSNTNYLVLGMLVEKASGMPYQDFVTARIIRPLGLRSTSFPATVPTNQKEFALGYSRSSGIFYETPPSSMSWAYAAGALFSNAADLVKWDDAFLRGRVVGASAVREMTTPAKLTSGEPTNYGFGWIISTLYGRREVWHNGGLPGFSTRNATFPDDDLEVVVLGNTISFDPGVVVRRVFAVLEPASVASAPVPTAAPGEDSAITARVKEWFGRLARNDIDRTQLTTEMNSALSADQAASLAAQLTAAGQPTSFVFLGKTKHDIYDVYQYSVICPNGSLIFTFVLDPAGKVAGLFLRPQ